MAIAPALFFTESFEGQIDDLLLRICVELQLDETRYRLAEDHYQAVGRWLESDATLARHRPMIYPQGSMRLNTTVRPLVGDEYDLDFVCELSCQPTLFQSPVDLLNIIERRLRENETYAPKVQRTNRCIRLNYEHQFHMDILPGCQDPSNGGTCILVPDRQLRQWKPSNPKGYAAWFDARARQRFITELLEKAEPLPDQQGVHEKPPLKLSVQLLKRWRDVRYKEKPELAPISIVLTTLAGQLYRGEQSIAVAIAQTLAGVLDLLNRNMPRLEVRNPSNPEEDLSERWDEQPEAYREFVRGISEFDAQWKALLQTRGIDKATVALQQLFGEEIARNVVEKQARDIEAARARKELGMKKGAGIITTLAGGSAVPVRPNTFYGDGE